MRRQIHVLGNLLLLLVVLFLPLVSVQAAEIDVEAETEIVAQGKCWHTENVWMIDSNGVLTIEGQGLVPTIPGSDDLDVPAWFDYTDLVKSVIIKEGITELDMNCFSNHINLETVSLPEGLTSIGSSCFYRCENLKEISLPSTLEKIGLWAFTRSGVEELDIPANVVELEDCFMGASIAKVTIDERNEVYCCKDNVIYSKDGTWLIKYLPAKEQKEYVVGEGVTSIANRAFAGCERLEKVVIPSDVTSIGDMYRDSCYPETNGGCVFQYCNKLQTVTFPEQVTVFYTRSLFDGCECLESVELPKGTTTIGEYAFYSCSSLNRVVFPEGLKEVNAHAFSGNTPLSEIVLPSTLEKIDSYLGRVLSSRAEKVTVYGYAGTLAEQVAQENNCKFERKEPVVLSSSKNFSATLSRTAYTYANKAWKPSVTVADDGTVLIRDVHYKVVYKNNKNVGTATVVINGIGKYTGSKTLSYKINPPVTTLTKLTPTTKGFTATIKKQATQTTGYQLRYSTKKDMSGSKTVTITKNSSCTKKITKLSQKKKYYVQVRTYTVKDGKKYYSAWSTAKTVVTK